MGHYIEESSSAICNRCGEVGRILQTWNNEEDEPHQVCNSFFCPSCGSSDLPWEGMMALCLPFTLETLPTAGLHAYQFGLNPLPKLRDLLKPIGMDVRFSIYQTGTGFSPDRPTLVVWVGYDDETETPDYVRVEIILPAPGGNVVWFADTDGQTY